MPRVPDDNLETSVYLYPTADAARQGLNAGGSGFIVQMPSRHFPDAAFKYVVTNRHVVREGHCLVLRLNDHKGEALILESEDHHWDEHQDGDDIAIAPIGLHPDDARFKCVFTDNFVTRDIIKEYDIGIGDEVYMVGRFINHEGKQKNMPSVRFGNISVMPIEPMEHPSGRPQESFGVEMRSSNGFSGSPVFVRVENFDPSRNSEKLRKDFRAKGDGNLKLAFYSMLLGVDWGHIPEYHRIYEKKGNKFYETSEKLYAKGNSHMSGVVPAWKIMEMLQMDKFRLQREQIETLIAEDREAKPSGAELDIATIESISDESDNTFTEKDFEEGLRNNSYDKKKKPTD